MNARVYILLSMLSIIGFLSLYLFSSPSPEEINTIPCEDPLTYSFGEIDARYNISEEELKVIMNEVNSLWEDVLNKPALAFDPDGQVKIHLVYGDEQERTEEEKRLSKQIEAKNKQIISLREDYDNTVTRLNNHQKDYEANVTEYNRLVEESNPKTKRALNTLKSKLKKLEYRINQQKEQGEILQRQVDNKAERLNYLSEQESELIASYNEKYAKAVMFDQGRFIKKGRSEKINIYQFSNKAELRAVLAHEVGHAMGLNHVTDPKAVMHSIIEQQEIFDLELSRADRSSILQLCQ